MTDIGYSARLAAAAALVKASKGRIETIYEEEIIAAIDAYEDELWQPATPPENVPREQWIVIYNSLTGFAYPRLYQKKEPIGVNVPLWRPAIKPPKGAQKDD